MPQPLSGPGVGLQIPTNLYPTELFNAPYDSSNPYFSLEGGEALVIPAGDWYVHTGKLSLLQYNDPQTGIWRSYQSFRSGTQFVKSDGFNLRIANLTGCPVAAVVTDVGSGYSQATTTVTPSAGNSQWTAVVGGTLSAPSIVSGGSGFTIPPLVFIPGPPSASVNGIGGVQATATCTLSSGVVNAVSLVNAGAGYNGTTITALLLPNPADPNAGSITTGSVSFTVGGAGTVAAVLCTNPGAPLSAPNSMTLTVSGAGTAAAVSPVVLQTVSSFTVSTPGAGYPDSAQLAVTSAGGRNTAVDATTNPQISGDDFVPLPVEGVAATSSGGAIVTADVTLYESGLFTAAPAPLVLDSVGTTAPGTAAVIAFTMGSAADTVFLQPAP